MPAPKIRVARPEEYDALGELTVRSYLADGPVGDYVEELRDAAGRAAAGTLLVAADGDELLGTVTVLTSGSAWTELAGAGEAEIRMLAVDPAARGLGVGTALAVACVEAARAGGARSVVLSTLARMHVAHVIYARLGFRRAPEQDWSPRPGVDLLAYRLDL